jgi:hypothetical protein
MPFKFNNILEYRKLIENKSYVEFSKVQKEYIKINLNIIQKRLIKFMKYYCSIQTPIVNNQKFVPRD